MSNYDMDEIDRTKSQKQKEQLGFGKDDQNNIKNILREAPKPVQQWDAQTQSYVSIGDQVDTHVKEMTRDPLGYAFRNDPKSTRRNR